MTKVKIKNALRAYESKYVRRKLPKITIGQKIITLDRNENNYGPSNQVEAAIISEIKAISQYTVVAAVPFRSAISEHFNLDSDQIIVTNGSFELISLIASVYQNAGHTAITCAPTFDWYRVATEINGGNLLELPLDDKHRFDLQAILQAITADTDIIWICNPNNPTGTFLTHQELATFLEKVPENILVVLDEAYIEYATVENFDLSVEWLEKYANVILLRTFSKIHGLASLRIGYGLANHQVINQLFGLKIPPNTNRLSIQAAKASLADKANLENVANLNAKQRAYYYQELEKRDLTYLVSQTNFILVDFKKDVAPIVAELKEKGILVRGGSEYGYPNWLRITIGTAEENQYFFATLDTLSLF